MATLQDYLGITKLRDAWPKWKANVIAVNNQVINHAAGTADKHAAQDITYSGSFTSMADVKAALDQAKTEIDTIVVNASVDPEVALARESSVKVKTFATIDARLEESEQDFVSAQAETTTDITNIQTNNERLNPLKTSLRVPMIAFIDDDGKTSAFTKTAPFFEARGLKFSFAVTPPFVGTAGYLSYPDILAMQSVGHEVCAHGIKHIMIDTLPTDEWETELKGSKDMLEANGCVVNNFVYPGGGNSKGVRDIARKYYKSAVTVNGVYDHYPYDMYGFPRPQLDWSTPQGITDLNAAIDVIATKKLFVVFVMHSWYTLWENQLQWDALAGLITYIQSKGIAILKLEDAVKQQGNLIDIGDTTETTYFKLGADGVLETKNIATLESSNASLQASVTALQTLTAGYKESIIQGYFLDFGAIPANGSKDLTVTLPGVVLDRANDNAIANPLFTMPIGITVSAFVTFDGLVAVRATNVTTAIVTLGATQQFKIVVFRG